MNKSKLETTFPWLETCGCKGKDYINIIAKWSVPQCLLKQESCIGWIFKAAQESKLEITKEQIKILFLDLIAQEQQQVTNWPFVWTYWEDGAKGDELKYSIRSVLRWQPDAQIVIVGDQPQWYAGRMILSPRIKKQEFHSFQDVYHKLQKTCLQYPQFVWMMDDVYWINSFLIDEAITPKFVRHVSQQRFHDWKPTNAWAKTRSRAYTWLLNNNFPTYDFAAHLPQPIRAATFQEMERKAQIFTFYKNWECVYFNMFYAANAIDYGRRFTRVTKPKENFSTRHSLMNHTDSAYRGGVEAFLAQNFPDKCQVEKI